MAQPPFLPELRDALQDHSWTLHQRQFFENLFRVVLPSALDAGSGIGISVDPVTGIITFTGSGGGGSSAFSGQWELGSLSAIAGSGEVTTDDLDPTLVTDIRIHPLSQDATDYSVIWGALVAGDMLSLVGTGGVGIYEITSSTLTGSGDYQLAVTALVGSGAFVVGDVYTVAFDKVGSSGGGDGSLGVTFSGGANVITVNAQADLVVPYNATLTAATLLADQVGSIVIDIWSDTFGNYPPTVLDTITGAAPPTLAAAIKSQDLSLPGWTTAITAGTTLRFNVTSVSSVTRVLLSLSLVKT